MDRAPFRNRLLARVLLVLTGIFLACLLVEGASWCVLRLSPSTQPAGRWELRASRPAPYHDADYFSGEFIDESMRCVRLRPVPNDAFIVHDDFHGRHINVSDGLRHTTDQPESWTRRVLFFGGSAVFGQEVPDRWTPASCLQRLLNSRPGPRWRVENHGACSAIAAQQTARLRDTDVRPGDVVIFCDGVNDVIYPVYNGNPKGWRPGDEHDGGVRRLSAIQRRLYLVCLAHKKWSATARLLLRSLEHQPPGNLTEPATLEEQLTAAEAGYRDALTEARGVASQRGARFFHFLQPSIFSLREPSSYETDMIRNELQTLPGLDQAFALGYPRLRAAAGATSFDLSGELDTRETGEEYYLDFCHVNHAANERIAEAIFARVWASSPEHPARGLSPLSPER